MIAGILKFGLFSIALVVFLVVGLAFAINSCDADLLLKTLAAETQGIVESVKSSSTDTFNEIQANIDKVAQLKENVQQSQMSGTTTSLDSIIADIEAITESYEYMAGQRDNIEKAILSKVQDIENMKASVEAEIKNLQLRRADYAGQLLLIYDPDPEITRTRKEALKRAIGYIDQQIELWLKFEEIEGDIIIEMSDIQTRIDRYLSMIESTGIVFREGLNLLILQRDINEAISLFSNDIPRMEQLTQDMEKSWDNLDFLLNSLTGVANIQVK